LARGAVDEVTGKVLREQIPDLDKAPRGDAGPRRSRAVAPRG
jgi:hypothetical protein